MFKHTEVTLYAPWIQKFHQNFQENSIVVVCTEQFPEVKHIPQLKFMTNSYHLCYQGMEMDLVQSVVTAFGLRDALSPQL